MIPEPQTVKKLCKGCSTERQYSDFSRGSGGGHSHYCKECSARITREWRARHPERARASVKANNAKQDPIKRRTYMREYMRQPPQQAQSRYRMLKKRYGITPEDYERMFQAQNGVCAICGKPQSKNYSLHVDHNHETGKVRGLLCFNCNTGLGFIERLGDVATAYTARTP